MNAIDFLNSKLASNPTLYTDYFNTFVTNTVDGTLGGLNSFISKTNAYFNSYTDPNSANSFLKNVATDPYSQLKKDTYYNIQSIYQKVSGLNFSAESVTLPSNTVPSQTTYIVNNTQQLSTLQNIPINEIPLFYNIKMTQDPYLLNGSKNPEVTSDFDLYQIFQVVDRGNNDISADTIADIGFLYENLYADFLPNLNEPTKNEDNSNVSKLTSISMEGFLSQFAIQSGFLPQRLPSYVNLNSFVANTSSDDDVYEIVDQLFGVHTDTTLLGNLTAKNNNSTINNNIGFSGGLSGFPSYIFQLGSVSSNVSVINNTESLKNNFKDSFMLDVGKNQNGEITILNGNAPNDVKNSNVTCFTVDFGKQNQQMFTSIDIDTSQFSWTEQSIKSWVDIVGANGVVPQTTNLFPIFEKFSYFCTITGLGNATIQPLTYFYLRNVPLFSGTYWITNVNHKISPNMMITTFKGGRQPIVGKNDVRLELLQLFEERSKSINKISNTITQNLTINYADTSGTIKLRSDSTNPYMDFMQRNKSGSGYTTFNGKEIIGRYIYSITGDNTKSPTNIALIAVLYNSAKGLKNTEDHTQIISAMANIAIGNMEIDSQRVIPGNGNYDDGGGHVSISKLFKVIGSGYNIIGDLSTLLDNITPSKTEYINNIKLPKGQNIYGIQAQTSQGNKLKKDHSLVKFIAGNTSIIPPANYDISTLNLFINTSAINYSDDIYPALPNTFTLFDIFNTIDNTNNTINNLTTTYTLISQPNQSANNLISEPITDITKSSFYISNVPGQAGQTGSNGIYQNVWLDYLGSLPTQYGIFNIGRNNTYSTWGVNFAMLYSDGTMGFNEFSEYLKSQKDYQNLTNDDWNSFFSSIVLPPINPKTGKYYPACFYDLANIATKLNMDVFTPSYGISLNDNYSFTFNNQTYGIQSDDTKINTQNRIANTYQIIANIIDEKWTNQNYIAPQPANISTQIGKILYMGIYNQSNPIVFFQTTNNGVSSGVVFNKNIESYYTYQAATIDDTNQIVQPAQQTPGNKRSSYVGLVQSVLVNEYNKWNGNTGILKDTNCPSDVQTLLTLYWKAANGTYINCTTDWSAPFISYIIRNTAVLDFPYNVSNGYIVKQARTNKTTHGVNSWFGYNVSDMGVNVEVGDIICYVKGKSLTTSFDSITENDDVHCDIILSIDTNNNARTIGGSVNHSVSNTYVQLTTDLKVKTPQTNLTDGTQIKYVGILKYQPIETTTVTSVSNFSGSITDLIKSSGYDPNSTIGIMAAQIATIEGYNNKKSICYLWNNPGDLTPQSNFKNIDPLVTQKTININGIAHTFAVFSTAQLGMKALIETKIKRWATGQMPTNAYNGQPPTFLQFFETFAPASDGNNPVTYATSVVNAVNKSQKTSYTINTTVQSAIV